jgi:hypothetical protein
MNWLYSSSPERQDTAGARRRATPDVAAWQALAADKDPSGTRSRSGAGHRLADISLAAPPAMETGRRPPIQSKLTVSQPDDAYEQEADRVAESVMRMPEASLSGAQPLPSGRPRVAACPVGERITPWVQRQTAGAEEEQENETPGPTETVTTKQVVGNPLQRQADAEGPEQQPEEQLEQEQEREQSVPVQAKRTARAPSVSPVLEASLNRTQGQGAALPAGPRRFFEPRFGHDFSRVRIHADGAAAQAAHHLNAQAFTRGADIYFGAGRYQPRSTSGRQLLAHELTHVVQQGAGQPAAAVQRQEEADELEALNAQVASRQQPVVPPTTITKAIEYLEEAQQWDMANPRDGKRSYELVYSVEQLVGQLVWSGKVRDAFYGKPVNLTYAEILCSSAYSELHSASFRLRSSQHPLRGLWKLIIGRMKGAKEYLEVANGERKFEESPIATTVDKWKYAPLLIGGGLFAAYVVIVAGGPLVIAELELMGGAALGAGRAAWLLYLTNPVAGMAIAEFALGTILTITANGIGSYIEQMKTPEGILITVFEVMIIRQAMQGGGYREYKGRIGGTPKGNQMEVEIIEGPAVVPGKPTTTTMNTPPPAAPVKRIAPPVEAAPEVPPVAKPVPAAPPVAKPAPITPPVGQTAEAPPVTKTPPPAAPAKDIASVEPTPQMPPAPKPAIPPSPETSQPPAAVVSKPLQPATADPYADLSLAQLKKRAQTDKTAAEAMSARYGAMSDTEVKRRAKGGDAMAQSERDLRVRPNKPLERLVKGHGNFSRSGVQSELEADIEAERASSGIRRTGRTAIDADVDVEGGTVGTARTDVEGLENEKFVGASPKAGGAVNPKSEFKPATDPEKLPHTHGHAEQQIADKLAPRLKEVPPEKLSGKTVWMLIEQEPCSTCASGIYDPNTAAGVLRKLSSMFPQLTFEIKNMNSTAVLRLRGGLVVTE